MTEHTRSILPVEEPASSRAPARPAQTSLAVVLICPHEERRRMLAHNLAIQQVRIVSELGFYPTYNQVAAVAGLESDAFIVEIDSDPEVAFDLLEAICARKASATVMAYSSRHDPDLVISAMRAGAREFLTGPLSQAVLHAALLRAAARATENSPARHLGKVFVFWSAKGGSGVTTIASNFAIALQQESGARVALLDLNPELGDVAVLLGLKPTFTLADALRSANRLDREFASTLVTPHSSGVSVVAAPDSYNSSLMVEARTVGKLVDLFRHDYPYVVADAGAGLAHAAVPLFQIASAHYVVTQVDIPSLRNTERFIGYLRTFGDPAVELVLNRFDARGASFDEDLLNKALGMKPKWKIPNDYATVARASNIGAPVIGERSHVGHVLRQMAQAASGKPVEHWKKSRGFFGR